MYEKEVHLEIIPSFKLFTPRPTKKLTAIYRISDSQVNELVSQTKGHSEEAINHFPVILINGDQWSIAVRYFLSRATEYSPPHPRTLLGIARDLRDYKRWVVENEVDYLVCESAPKSPVRRFKRYLIASDYSASVISRKMSRLVAFYRWLIEAEGLEFDKPLWNERDLKLLTVNSHGSRLAFDVKTTDVQQIKQPRAHLGNGYDGLIRDGGLLKPHSLAEQKIILAALNKIGNSEMTLSFLVALVTGARMQSVFTLRKCHFEKDVDDSETEVVILGGAWPRYGRVSESKSQSKNASLINTKSSKATKFYFPVWVYKQIQTYLKSERYQLRCSKSAHYASRAEEQYVFLTTRGKPYYIGATDALITTYLNPPLGASVQQFIAQQLKPMLSEMKFSGHFKFHNLRATYGMNLVRSYLQTKENPEGLAPTELFGLVRSRLNHSSSETTQLYLSFDLKHKLAEQSQTDYENHLKSMISGVYCDF